MKKEKGQVVDMKKLKKEYSPSLNHTEWTTLLKKHVSYKGIVNYKGFIIERHIFQLYLDKLSENTPGNNWTETENIAYWINVYNAFTVKLVLDFYPIKSIRTMSDGLSIMNSPWQYKFFKIGGIEFDLDTIEHQILRKEYNEPRIHFAINCASFSCPKLRNEAYYAKKLEDQLKDQTIEFLSDPSKNIITKDETKLSQIFDWFLSDFLKKSSIQDFLIKYNSNYNAENKIEFLPYNWSLNE